MTTLLTAFVFLLPAGIANMAPVLFSFIPWGSFPIDGRLTFRGRRIMGDNKTLRGFAAGWIAGVLTTIVLTGWVPWLLPEFALAQPVLFGTLMGIGALVGDSVESFFKRQLDIPPGDRWMPFDQIDWILGALLFTAPVVPISAELALVCIVLFGLLHPLTNIIGKLVGLRRAWL